MRKIISMLFFPIVLWSSTAFTQGYFPLQKGNLWQYYETPWYPIETAQVLGDTILPNGHTYAICSGIGFPGNFLRQSGAKVYSVDSQGEEFVVFDFAANVSDVVGINESTSDTIRLDEKGFDSGFNQNYWVFTSGNEIAPTYRKVIDSLGICYMVFEPGMQFTLQGARINGIVRYGTITSVSQKPAILPVGISLIQNYPNPFNPSTIISFQLKQSNFVTLDIFDVNGRKISRLVDSYLRAGHYKVQWNASGFASGVYLYKLSSKDFVQTRKMIYIK